MNDGYICIPTYWLWFAAAMIPVIIFNVYTAQFKSKLAQASAGLAMGLYTYWVASLVSGIRPF